MFSLLLITPRPLSSTARIPKALVPCPYSGTEGRKDKVANGTADDDGQTEVDLIGHGYEHEGVTEDILKSVKKRLKEVKWADEGPSEAVSIGVCLNLPCLDDLSEKLKSLKGDA